MPRRETRTARPIPGLRRARSARARGFTIVELVIALGLAALLAAAAVPAFHDWVSAYQLANYARHLAESMTRARTEAIRRAHRVNLCKSPDREQCAGLGSWEGGFLMYVDINHDGRIDAGEPVLEIEGRAPPGITITANGPLDDYVSYTSIGHARMLNGALQMGTFTVCKRGQPALHVVLANSGRVRTERTAVVCP
jgi:type IV fimbrial biogenesis protein FimT